MKTFLYVLSIIFLVLGLVFTILPLGTIAFLPIGLALIFAAIAFFVRRNSLLTDQIITASGDSMNCKITEIKNESIFFSYDKTGNVISLPLNRVTSYKYDFYKNQGENRKPAKVLLIFGAVMALIVIIKVLAFSAKVTEKTEEEQQRTEQRAVESLEALEALEVLEALENALNDLEDLE